MKPADATAINRDATDALQGESMDRGSGATDQAALCSGRPSGGLRPVAVTGATSTTGTTGAPEGRRQKAEGERPETGRRCQDHDEFEHICALRLPARANRRGSASSDDQRRPGSAPPAATPPLYRRPLAALPRPGPSAARWQGSATIGLAPATQPRARSRFTVAAACATTEAPPDDRTAGEIPAPLRARARLALA